MSASFTGRRNARRARVVRIVRAQAGFFLRALRIADENLRAARRGAAAGRAVGSADDQLPDVGRAARHVESLDAGAVQPQIDGRRDLGSAAAATASCAAAAAAPAGPSLSTFRFSRGDVTPTQCSPALTGTRTW